MIKEKISQSICVHQLLLKDNNVLGVIQQLVDDCINVVRLGYKIILCGNGGSFADAQHISAEFTARFLKERDSISSIALGCNNSSISAIGNDYSYHQVFARELSSISSKGDVFIPISTSGNSENIIEAIKVANQKELIVYGLTGNRKGQMTSLCPCIEVPSDSTPRIQECHILIGHIVCEMVEDNLSS